MESKLGENFLSLQGKDRTAYPLPPFFFTSEILRPPPPLSLHCRDRTFSPDFDSIP